MTRREQCEVILASIESAGLPVGPLGDELRALWRLKEEYEMIAACMVDEYGDPIATPALDAYHAEQGGNDDTV